jgi:hypothetical protein
MRDSWRIRILATFSSVILLITAYFFLARTSAPNIEISPDLKIDSERVTPTIDSTSATGTYIPIDLPTAVQELRTMLPPDLLNRLSLEDSSAAFMLNWNSGEWLSTHWQLSGLSRLALYFHSENIDDPLDMTAIIIDALVRDLSSQPWSVSRQLDCGRRLSKQRTQTAESRRYRFTCP